MRSQKVTFKKIWLGTALAVWGIVVSLAVMPFFSGHLLVFEGWGKNLALQAKGSWALTHILGEGCVCSETIGKYLLNRGLIELHEKILFLGTNLPLEAELKAKGFQIEKRDPATLSPEAASAVPTLLISDPSGAVVYSGGYADHKIRAGAEIQDVKMLERLKTQTHLAVLPVFGCAMSKRYQNLLDPLGVKSRGLLR